MADQKPDSKCHHLPPLLFRVKALQASQDLQRTTNNVVGPSISLVSRTRSAYCDLESCGRKTCLTLSTCPTATSSRGNLGLRAVGKAARFQSPIVRRHHQRRFLQSGATEGTYAHSAATSPRTRRTSRTTDQGAIHIAIEESSSRSAGFAKRSHVSITEIVARRTRIAGTCTLGTTRIRR